jgi:hypothetical protein
MRYSQPASTDSGPPIPALNVVSSGVFRRYAPADDTGTRIMKKVSDFQEILLRVLMMRISIFVDVPPGRTIPSM